MESVLSHQRKSPEITERQVTSESKDRMTERTLVEQAEENVTIDGSESIASSEISMVPDTAVAPKETIKLPKPEDFENTSRTATNLEAPNQQATKPKSAESSVPLSLSDQNLAVFGTLNTRLADAFMERIESAITEGVDSLPLLDGDSYRDKNKSSPSETSNKTPKQRLWDALRYRFVRNVDVLEAYCAHNLLTLRKHPPARRKRIVAVMGSGPEVLLPLDTKDEIQNFDGEGDVPYKYPTRSELPSEQERNKLAEELSKMQADLESAKQHRNTLLASVKSAERAEQAVVDIVATIEANIPTLKHGEIRSQVAKKVERGNTVGLLAEETRSLVGKLDGIKKDRNQKMDNDDNENDYDFVQREDPFFRASNRAGNKRHKPLSLEEAYVNDRRRLGLLADSTNDNQSSGLTVTALKSMAMSMASNASPSH